MVRSITLRDFLVAKRLPDVQHIFFTGYDLDEGVVFEVVRSFVAKHKDGVTILMHTTESALQVINDGGQGELFGNDQSVDQQSLGWMWINQPESASEQKALKVLFESTQHLQNHYLVCLREKDAQGYAHDRDLLVAIPAYVDEALFIELAYIDPSASLSKKALQVIYAQLSKRTGGITLSSAWSILRHLPFMGLKADASSVEYLFNLAESGDDMREAFGALARRDVKGFCSIWQSLGTQFSEQFWLAYFANQVWRMLLLLERAKKAGSSGKINFTRDDYALPASLTWRGGWRNVSARDLIALQKTLYDADKVAKLSAGDDALTSALLAYVSE